MVQYDDKCLLQQQCMSGVESLVVVWLPWLKLSAPLKHYVVTSESTATVEAIVMHNRCIMVYDIAPNLNISHCPAHHIIHKVLKFNKVLVRWVPQKLTTELKV